MNSTTHMTVGGLSGGLVLAYCIANRTPVLDFVGYAVYPAAAVIGGMVGGVAPDVDMRRSKAGHALRRALRVIWVVSTLFLLVISFVSHTGIGFLDRLVDAGMGVDKRIPLVLAAFCVITMVVIEKSKHRGFTHTLVALGIVAAPLLFMILRGSRFVGADVVASAQIGFLLGWFSHMLIDSFNYPGTPWLWPAVRKHFRVMRVDSGTDEERVFRMLCIGVFMAFYAFIIF